MASLVRSSAAFRMLLSICCCPPGQCFGTNRKLLFSRLGEFMFGLCCVILLVNYQPSDRGLQWSAFSITCNFIALKNGQISVMGLEEHFLADTLLEAFRVFWC